MLTVLGVLLIIAAGAIGYSHLQKIADKGFRSDDLWKVAADAVALGVGVWIVMAG